MISQAYAEALTSTAGSSVGAAASTQSPLMSLIPFVLVFVIFYFLIFRPQQKKLKEHNNMLTAIKASDKVLTSGGIVGRVIKVEDIYLTVEIAPNTEVKLAKTHIAKVIE